MVRIGSVSFSLSIYVLILFVLNKGIFLITMTIMSFVQIILSALLKSVSTRKEAIDCRSALSMPQSIKFKLINIVNNRDELMHDESKSIANLLNDLLFKLYLILIFISFMFISIFLPLRSYV